MLAKPAQNPYYMFSAHMKKKLVCLFYFRYNLILMFMMKKIHYSLFRIFKHSIHINSQRMLTQLIFFLYERHFLCNCLHISRDR